MKEPSLSERLRKPWKQLIDVHENSGFNTKKKNPSRARVSGNRCNDIHCCSVVTRYSEMCVVFVFSKDLET